MKKTHHQHALHVANMRALLALFKGLDSGANPLRKKSRNGKPEKGVRTKKKYVRPSTHLNQHVLGTAASAVRHT